MTNSYTIDRFLQLHQMFIVAQPSQTISIWSQSTFHVPMADIFNINVCDTGLLFTLTNSETLDIGFYSVFLTATQIINNCRPLSPKERQLFQKLKQCRIDFLLKKPTEPILLEIVHHYVKVQLLKWAFSKTTTTGELWKTRYRARLVSALHNSMLRRAIRGSAPTVMLNTLRMLASIIFIWTAKTEEKIVTFGLNVIKAYVQNIESQLLFVYQPTLEHF